MPQMKPLNWLILFFMFLIILLIKTIMNYFSKVYLNYNLKLNNKLNYKNYSWKW